MFRLASMVFVSLGLGAGMAHGQPSPPIQQTKLAVPASAPSRDFSKLTPESRDIYLSAQRAATWLRLANRPDGRFVFGFLPALRVPMEGDSLLAQGGATQSLIRAAKFFEDQASLATARQALLAILEETEVHPQDSRIRYPNRVTSPIDRLAGAGIILSAIHELPEPSEQLFAQADQIANGIRISQQADGSLIPFGAAEASVSPEALAIGAGLALQGIIEGHSQKPAAWRIEFVRKAHTYYESQWRKQKSLPLAINHTPAYAKAYLACKDSAYADTVFAMNDWIVTLQYHNSNALASHWAGGFQSWIDGKLVGCAPDIHSAKVAESLAWACQIARAAGDRERLQTYSLSLHNSLLFLTRLQYTDARASHFVEAFRPAVVGGFHASHQDGNLRVDHTQHALNAMLHYLDRVIDWP